MIRCTLNIPLVTHDRGGDDEKKKKFTSSVEKKTLRHLVCQFSAHYPFKNRTLHLPVFIMCGIL